MHALLCKSIAPWAFVLKPGTKSLLPPWLSIAPTSGVIVPGERVTVALTVHVTPSCASALNFPLSTRHTDDALSDLFVLSIEKRDLFLAVLARSYVPSVFGSSLDHLARLGRPIRSTTLEERERIASAVTASKKPESERSDDEKKDLEVVGNAGVPRAIYQLVSLIAKHASANDDVFSTEGDGNMVALLKDSLDTASLSIPDRRNRSLTPWKSHDRGVSFLWSDSALNAPSPRHRTRTKATRSTFEMQSWPSNGSKATSDHCRSKALRRHRSCSNRPLPDRDHRTMQHAGLGSSPSLLACWRCSRVLRNPSSQTRCTFARSGARSGKKRAR